MTDQYPGAQPPYPPAPQYASAPTEIPGKTLGIVAVILTFVVSSVLGLILGYVARNQSRTVGYQNTPATVAIIAGWILTVLGALSIIFVIVMLVAFAPMGANYR